MEQISQESGGTKELLTLTQVIYGLQAAGFLFGITWVVALVINYVKIDEVRGTWLESHFRWQIRTFWFGLLWFSVGVITFLIVIGWAILTAASIWIIYRVIKGWLDLSAHKAMYASHIN